VIAELEDLGAELRGLVERVEDDPHRLEEVRARRRLLGELTRKYGDTLVEVIAYRDELDQRRAELLAYEERAAELEAAITELERQRRKLARDVGDRRRRAAPTLARELEAHLRQVALPDARVEVVIDDDEDGDGNRVELQLSTNRGLEPRPLARVASGGELSRAMLALHLTLSTGPPTMVFDEVDAGLGGVAATTVGRSLARLAANRQVIVVTHLAQVAAFAQDQLVVEKSAEGSVTSTCIRRLEPQERVMEISRMMSGSPQSTAAREHAEELLAAAASEWSR
jgi:DNA repair protein RecN (Recombination protein N)